MTTGERIRQARLAAGFTQTELAEKIGVKFSAIHKYESGLVVNLKRETIAALSDALSVKPSWLMCLDDEQEKTESAELKAQHDEINAIFDRMPPEIRNHAIALLRGLAQSGEYRDNPEESD